MVTSICILICQKLSASTLMITQLLHRVLHQRKANIYFPILFSAKINRRPFVYFIHPVCRNSLAIAHILLPHVKLHVLLRYNLTLMNIGSHVWLFLPAENPIYCHKNLITSDSGNVISIKEPSIVRMLCGYPIKCTHAELSSMTCINRRVMVKSTAHGSYEELTIIPCSINNMTKRLIPIYELKI